jgi:hypothetical protein
MPKKDTKSLHKQIFKQLKEASTNPHPAIFIKTFAKFFAIATIGLVTLTLAIAIIAKFVGYPLRNRFIFGNGCLFNKSQFMQDPNSAWMKQRLDLLEKTVNKEIDQKYWANNTKQYTHDLTNFRGILEYVQAITSYTKDADSISRQYVYKFTVCKIAGNGDECITIADKANPQRMRDADNSNVMFYFDNDEIIDSLSFEAFELFGIDDYIYTGEIITNKKTYPIMVYPSANGSNTYYMSMEVKKNPNSILRFVEDLESGIRFKLETPEYMLQQASSIEVPADPLIELYVQQDGNINYITNIAPSD